MPSQPTTRHLITSALPYINGGKHLGNLVGSMLPADVYARYLRERGHEVLFICATDEHGTPAELAARAAGLPVAEFCRRQHEAQRATYERLRLSFDHFGRTSCAANHELTQHFARRLDENGLIAERVAGQLYSPADGRFLPDRYVVGTCPHCGFTDARGDQCDECTRLLDPAELIEPRSAVSGAADLEVRETRHLVFEQSKLADRLRVWISTRTGWPRLTTSIALKWLDEGLEDRGITRDLSWGVPVDRPGFEGKVFDVWFDAPIGYIAATREWAERDPAHRDWRSWWLGDTAHIDAESALDDVGSGPVDTARVEPAGPRDVRYTQFMGKDNVPFHTIMFPAAQAGTGEPWKRADYIKSLNWLDYYGGRFSTSRGRGVFLDQALDLLPADYWRYFLLANAPESDDVSFTWELFAAQCDKDLAGTLGNLVNRVLSFSARRFGETVPQGGTPGAAGAALGVRFAELIAEYEDHLDALSLRKAVRALRALWSLGNAYLAEKEPWTAIKTDREDAALTVRTTMNLIRLLAPLSRPVVPDTADRIDAVFGFEPVGGSDSGTGPASGPDRRTDAPPRTPWPTPSEARALDALPPGVPFTVPGLLFRKITDADVAAWRERFGAPG